MLVRARAARGADGALQLHFAVHADPASLCLPQPVAPAGFADGLWQHTCFEAFVGVPGLPRYHEFNLSPSGQWAAYAFAAYRQRDEAWQPAASPVITNHLEGDVLTLEAQIPSALLPTTVALFDISLTAVIECADGSLSYWALAHTGERPDFHQRASFTLRLEA